MSLILLQSVLIQAFIWNVIVREMLFLAKSARSCFFFPPKPSAFVTLLVTNTIILRWFCSLIVWIRLSLFPLYLPHHRCSSSSTFEASLKVLRSAFEATNTFLSPFSFQMVTRTKKIFVGGLSANTVVEDVKQYFEQFGKVRLFYYYYYYSA